MTDVAAFFLNSEVLAYLDHGCLVLAKAAPGERISAKRFPGAGFCGTLRLMDSSCSYTPRCFP